MKKNHPKCFTSKYATSDYRDMMEGVRSGIYRIVADVPSLNYTVFETIVQKEQES